MSEKDKILPTSIRLPLELKEKLEKAAKEDQRSVNNLIVLILSRWVKEHEKD